MIPIQIKRKMNTDALRQVEPLNVLLFEGEVNAHQFLIEPADGVSFAGAAVTAFFVRADNQRVDLTGAVTGEGEAAVTLGPNCYATPGRYRLTIFVTIGEETAAVYACCGSVRPTRGSEVAGDTEPIVEPGVPIGDRLDAIEAHLDGIESNLTERFAAEISNYSDEWAWIKARIQAGNLSGIHVGDYIPVSLPAHAYLSKARIIGINTYKGLGTSHVGNHIDFMLDDLGGSFQMNLVKFNNGISTSKRSPWLASNGYYYLNSLAGDVPNAETNVPATTHVDYTTVSSPGIGGYVLLPDKIKNVIVEKYAYNPRRFDANAIQTSDNTSALENIGKVWIPTEVELTGYPILGSKQGALGGVQYPWFAHNLNRIVSQYVNMWTMTAADGDSTKFVAISKSGYLLTANANSTYASLPCFRVA